jgi:DNA-binding transcriptional MerR regulator
MAAVTLAACLVGSPFSSSSSSERFASNPINYKRLIDFVVLTWYTQNSKGTYFIMSTSYYTTKEVSQLTGFSVRQLDYWAHQNIIVPSVQKARGSGTRKKYSLDDLVILQFIRQLSNNGWSIQKIRSAILTLREVQDDPNPLRSAILVHSGGTILAVCKNKQGERILIDTLKPHGQQVMSIVLDLLRTEVQEAAILNQQEAYSYD